MKSSSTASFRYPREIVPSNNYPTRIVSCIVLASMVVGFFLIYGLIFHPDDLRTATIEKRTVTSANAADRPALIAASAPEPDMDSDAIRFANSDVISQPIHVTPSSRVTLPSEATATEPARHIPKPKAIKRLSGDAANAYASERHYYSRPEIGTE
jgi:hypothetical protein